MAARIVEFDMGGIHCYLGNPFGEDFSDKWGLRCTKQINGADYDIGFQMPEQIVMELLVSLENAVYSFNKTEKKLAKTARVDMSKEELLKKLVELEWEKLGDSHPKILELIVDYLWERYDLTNER